jgi:hypothetical protein
MGFGRKCDSYSPIGKISRTSRVSTTTIPRLPDQRKDGRSRYKKMGVKTTVSGE